MKKKYITPIALSLLVVIVIYGSYTLGQRSGRNTTEVVKNINQNIEANSKNVDYVVPGYVAVLEKVDQKHISDPVFDACGIEGINSCLKTYNFTDSFSGSVSQVLDEMTKKSYHSDFNDCVGNTIFTCQQKTINGNIVKSGLNACNEFGDQSLVDNCLSENIPKTAVELKDISLCGNFKTDALISNCEDIYRVKTVDCDKINNASLKSECSSNKTIETALNSGSISGCSVLGSEELASQCEIQVLSALSSKNNSIKDCKLSKKPMVVEACSGKYLSEKVLKTASNREDCQKISSYDGTISKEILESMINVCISKFATGGALNLGETNNSLSGNLIQ